MLKISFPVVISLFFFLFSSFSKASFAQIDLFDSNRGKPPASNKAKSQKKPKAKTKKSRKKNIDLTLIGISRNGEHTTVYFKDKKRQQIRLKIKSKESYALPGYENLIIEKIDNRSLIIADKKQEYCKDNAAKGISCSEDNKTIEMKLVRKYIAAPKGNPLIKNKAKRNTSQRGAVPARAGSSSRAKRVIKTPFGNRSVNK